MSVGTHEVTEPTKAQLIEAANNLLAALEGSQCWGGTYIGEKMQALDALIIASPCNPEAACKTHGRCWTHSHE